MRILEPPRQLRESQRRPLCTFANIRSFSLSEPTRRPAVPAQEDPASEAVLLQYIMLGLAPIHIPLTRPKCSTCDKPTFKGAVGSTNPCDSGV